MILFKKIIERFPVIKRFINTLITIAIASFYIGIAALIIFVLVVLLNTS